VIRLHRVLLVLGAAASVVLTLGAPVGGPVPIGAVAAASTTAATTTTTFGDGDASAVAAERPLPTGGFSVTLVDPMTAQPVRDFCVEAVDDADAVVRTGCTDTGTLLLADVPAGDYLVLASRTGRTEVAGVARAEVAVGAVVDVVAE
jgi:hypothetical protein